MTEHIQRISVNNPSGSTPNVPNFPASAGTPLTSNVPDLSEDVDRRIAERLPTELPPTPPIEELDIPETPEPEFPEEKPELPAPLPPIRNLIPLPKFGAAMMLNAYDLPNSPPELSSYQSALGAQLFGGVMGQTIPLQMGLIALTAAVQAIAAVVGSIPGGKKVSVPRLPALDMAKFADTFNDIFAELELRLRNLKIEHPELSDEELAAMEQDIRNQAAQIIELLVPQQAWRQRFWFNLPDLGIGTINAFHNIDLTGLGIPSTLEASGYEEIIIRKDSLPDLLKDFAPFMDEGANISEFEPRTVSSLRNGNFVEILWPYPVVRANSISAVLTGIFDFDTALKTDVVYKDNDDNTFIRQEHLFLPIDFHLKHNRFNYIPDPNKLITIPTRFNQGPEVEIKQVSETIKAQKNKFQSVDNESIERKPRVGAAELIKI